MVWNRIQHGNFSTGTVEGLVAVTKCHVDASVTIFPTIRES
jgi:hypothetical protein